MDTSTELSITCHARGRRLLHVFPTINTLQDAIDLVFSNKCIDACMQHCEHGGTRCPHPKAHFQSTRNSSRSTHAYLFLLAMTGSPATITDFMVKAVRGNLTPVCAHGVRLSLISKASYTNRLYSAYNGHRISTDPNHRQVCINPFHYKVRNVRAVIQLFIDAQLLPKNLVTHISNAPAGVVVATIHDAILNGTIMAPSIKPYKATPHPTASSFHDTEIDVAITMCAMQHSCPAPAPLSPIPI